MTRRDSRRRMIAAALVASSLFTVTACTSKESGSTQSASTGRQSGDRSSASPSVTASVTPAVGKVDANPPVASFNPKAHARMEARRAPIGRPCTQPEATNFSARHLLVKE